MSIDSVGCHMTTSSISLNCPFAFRVANILFRPMLINSRCCCCVCSSLVSVIAEVAAQSWPYPSKRVVRMMQPDRDLGGDDAGAQTAADVHLDGDTERAHHERIGLDECRPFCLARGVGAHLDRGDRL